MDRTSATGRWVALCALLALAPGSPGAPAEVRAQVTSPGPLSVAHSDWSDDCSRCHELGRRGISDARCLACHAPLAGRIERGTGYHATRTEDCASCHREHRGEDARPVVFEAAGFDHAATGYPLAGAHSDLDCAGCHNTLTVRDREVRLFKGRYGALSRTYLGLLPSCAACHDTKDPHGEQFAGRECAACHGERGWAPAERFDHALTDYPLTGRHAGVECADCHRREAIASGEAAGTGTAAASTPPAERVVYRPVAHASCAGCHRDAHRGDMGPSCSDCHSTAGWRRIPRTRFEGDFDHASTGFALAGLHASAPCAACHEARADDDPAIHLAFESGRRLSSYPRPAADACSSCHVDYHDGVFGNVASDGACASCHTEAGWRPSGFDVFRHGSSALPLTGVHRVVPCEDCHRREGDDAPFVVRLGDLACADCHVADDPHAGQFGGRGCAECHDTRAEFAIAAFDHAATRFPLDGEHEDAPCAACHASEGLGDERVVRYRPLSSECRSCHADFGAGDES